jgi:2-keto-4-pentenoate hydratase/2-oxohepta-3-ene-1,7-dioic acid hydratase in catechol pathway
LRLVTYEQEGVHGLAVQTSNGEWHALRSDAPRFPGRLESILASGRPAALSEAGAALATGRPIDVTQVVVLPPLARPPKIICVGLNYAEHAKEAAMQPQSYPSLFIRFPTTLTGHRQPIVRPSSSVQLDFEGELVAVIGRGGRHIDRARALEHVAGWSIFNDVSVRDYQFKTTQWTMGKNFDGTGPFGPCFVTADELPAGGKGLRLETRLNGTVMQSARTDDMIFDVATLIAIISEAMTLEPGDLLVTGTPSGVGFARTPPLWMKAGDVVEVEIEGIGVLSNPVRDAVA